MTLFDLQAKTYEALAPLGPQLSALCSGFAVVVWGEMLLTPAGQTYLDKLEQDK
jgi:hypothetical protein